MNKTSPINRYFVAGAAAVLIVGLFAIALPAEAVANDISLTETYSPSAVFPGDKVTFTVTIHNPMGQTVTSMASTFWGPTGSTITSTSRSGGAKGPQWDNGTQWGRPTWDWGQRTYLPQHREVFTVTVKLLDASVHKCGTTYGSSYQDWTPADPVVHTQFTTKCPVVTPTPTPTPTPTVTPTPTPTPTTTPSPKVIVKNITIENNAVQKQEVEQTVIIQQEAAPQPVVRQPQPRPQPKHIVVAPAPKPAPAKPTPQPQVKAVTVTTPTGPGALGAMSTLLGTAGIAAVRRFLLG